MEYQVCEFTELVRWVQDRDGVYWVNPKYLDEFLELYDLMTVKK